MATKYYTFTVNEKSIELQAPPFNNYEELMQFIQGQFHFVPVNVQYEHESRWVDLNKAVPLGGIYEFRLVPPPESDLMNEYRFYHIVSSDEAYTLLMDKPNGTFLIRPSNEKPHLTVEYVSNFCVQKKKIVVENGTFRMHTSKKQWVTLTDLISHEKALEVPLYRKDTTLNNRKDEYEASKMYSLTPSEVSESPPTGSGTINNHYDYTPDLVNQINSGNSQKSGAQYLNNSQNSTQNRNANNSANSLTRTLGQKAAPSPVVTGKDSYNNNLHNPENLYGFSPTTLADKKTSVRKQNANSQPWSPTIIREFGEKKGALGVSRSTTKDITSPLGNSGNSDPSSWNSTKPRLRTSGHPHQPPQPILEKQTLVLGATTDSN